MNILIAYPISMCFCLGLYYAMKPKKILEFWWKLWNKKNKDETFRFHQYVRDGMSDCHKCMATLFGTISYFVCLFVFAEINIKTLIFTPIFIFSLSYLNELGKLFVDTLTGKNTCGRD